MQIQGHTLEEQDELSEEFQALVLAAMQSVIDTVVLRVVRQGASQGLTAAGSVDDVADDIIILWDDQIPELVSYLDGVYDAGSLEAASELAAQLTMPEGMGIPGIPDSFTLDYMSQASNRLKGIGDDVWENIRNELVTGIQNGDSIDELAQRVRIAGSMSESRAKTIARTELVGASNAGTHTQVLMIVPESKKEWVSTADMRTRQTHLHADGQLVPVNATFTVGAAHLRYPGDPGGLVGEIVNCRCTLIYDVDDDAEPETICACEGTLVSAYVPVTSSSCTCKVTYPTPSGAGTFNVTPSQHKQIFDAFMGKQPISPAYGGAKIYKKLQEARAELANTAPHLSGLSDHDILAIVDETYDGAKKFTFTQKFDEWLASPAGKKAVPTGSTPTKVVPPTPSTSTPTIPTPSVPTPSSPSTPSVLPPIKPLPNPKNLTYTGKTLGSHGAQVWVDDTGGKWLFKPQSKFMTEVDKSMAVLKSKSVATRTATYDITLNGKHGSIQYMFDGSTDAWPGGKMPAQILTPKEVTTLQQEQMFDWLIGNHDAHKGQFVRLPDGSIVGVDKGQAFKFFGTDKLDWTYTAPGNVGTPVYNTLWKAFVDGKIDIPDPTTGAAGEYLQTLMDIPDDVYRALLTPYAKGVPKLPGGFKTVDEFLDAAVARKNNLKKDFSDFYQRAVAAKAKKSGGSTPSPTSTPSPSPSPSPTIAPPPPGGLPTPSLAAPFKDTDLGIEVSAEEIFQVADNAKIGDVVAEAFTSYGVPMRILVSDQNAWGTELKTQYWMNGKWNDNNTKIITENQLKNEHINVKWQIPHKTSSAPSVPAPATPPTPSVVTTHAPVTPSSVTLGQKHGLLHLMKETQPITPGWGGAKVYKQLEQIKLKIAGNPAYEGLTDKQLLQLMDEVAPHATSKTYESVVVDWLNTPAGKKYTGGDASILDTPKPGAVTTPTPSAPVTPPTSYPTSSPFAAPGAPMSQISHVIFDLIDDSALGDVVDKGVHVDIEDVFTAAKSTPDNSVLAVAKTKNNTYARLYKQNGYVWYQIRNPATGDWVDVNVVDSATDLEKYATLGDIKSWYIPEKTKLPSPPASSVPSTPSPTPVKKYAKKAKKTASTPTSVALHPDLDVDAILNDSSPISTISDSNQTNIFTQFKNKSVGSYLNNTPEEIFNHVAATLQELKKFPQYANLTPLQIIRIVDELGAKKFSVTNTKMFETKLTDWLKTPAGKKHATDISSGKTAIPKHVAKKAAAPTWTPPSVAPKVATHTKPPTPDMTPLSQNAKPMSTRPYESMYHTEVQEMREEMFAQQGGWTAAQKSSLRYYTSNAGYSAMNGCLRGYLPCSPATLKHIKEAQAGMRRSTRNVILRRGTNADEFPGFGKNATTAELKTLIGRELKADSFLSSSYGDKPDFSGNVMLEFEIPAGVPMMYIKDISHYSSSENEILLAAGLRYVVESVTDSGYKRVVKVKVIVP